MTTNYTINGTNFETTFLRRDLFSQGGLWTCGYNVNGQLGINNTTAQSSPVQTISSGSNWRQISALGFSMEGIKTDGTLWSWGDNTYGQLGDNTITKRSSPVQTISGGNNWKQVAGGTSHVIAIKTDGTLWTWGRNNHGQLGSNNITNYSSPVQTVAGGTTWKLVAGGVYSTAAIKTDGTLWLWGQNTYGMLGDNTNVKKSSPVQTIAGGNNWKLVAVGQYTTGAIKTDGTLWVWGWNMFGQLGLGTSGDNRASPVQTIAGGTNWKTYAAGTYSSFAIKTDGTLWSWGYNYLGMLGDNTTNNKSSPAQTIAAGTNWKTISVSSYTPMAIKTDGTVWLWGNNGAGQLGNNQSSNAVSSPIQTVAGGTNWKQVTSGSDTTAAISDIF